MVKPGWPCCCFPVLHLPPVRAWIQLLPSEPALQVSLQAQICQPHLQAIRSFQFLCSQPLEARFCFLRFWGHPWQHPAPTWKDRMSFLGFQQKLSKHTWVLSPAIPISSPGSPKTENPRVAYSSQALSEQQSRHCDVRSVEIR